MLDAPVTGEVEHRLLAEDGGVDLVRGTGIRSPAELLLTGAAIWLTNVIVFGLWYAGVA